MQAASPSPRAVAVGQSGVQQAVRPLDPALPAEVMKILKCGRSAAIDVLRKVRYRIPIIDTLQANGIRSRLPSRSEST